MCNLGGPQIAVAQYSRFPPQRTAVAILVFQTVQGLAALF